MSTDEGKAFGVTDGEYVDVLVDGERKSMFYYDDANAAGVGNGFKAKLIKK